MTYCTVEYDGRGLAAEHLRKGFMLRERHFVTGERVEVPSDEAGLLIDSAPTSTVKVHAGEPTRAPARPRRADEAILRRDRLREAFPKDPARFLSGVAALPKDVRDALAGKGAAEFIAAGRADACLFDAATWAQLSGLDEVAKACARRAPTLTRKG